MKKTIQEGKASIIIQTKDIATKNQEVFYNPKMELNRTLSILLLRAIKKKSQQILLPLAGTGVRGIRLLLELPKNMIKGILLNDVNPKAATYMNQNLVANNLEKETRVKITTQDANTLLSNTEYGFDYIDIDPFGSPNFLLDNAIRRLKGKAILAVTATDTAPLAGAYPLTCKTKYWATASDVPAKHELGLRILARKVQLLGMHHEKSLLPIFSYHHEHYYRIYFLCERGKQKAAKRYEFLTGIHSYCTTCGQFFVGENKLKQCPYCKERTLRYTGPLYTGALQDVRLLKAMKKIAKDKNIIALLENLITESSVKQVGQYDMHDLAHKNKTTLQKFEVYEKLLLPYTTVRSTTNKYGFKTTAPAKNVHALFKKKKSS